MGKNIIIISDHIGGEISPSVHESIACARIIQKTSGGSVKIIISGYENRSAARQLSVETGIDVIIIAEEKSEATQTEIFKSLPADFYADLDPIYICMPHNSFGLEVAPGLALKLNGSCITGVENILTQKGRLCFQRKIFNDKIAATVVSDSPITVLTIQTGSFKPAESGTAVRGTTQVVTPVLSLAPSRHLGTAPSKHDTSTLTGAEVIVSAGNGIGKEENLDLIYQLAGLFPKAAIAGSRPVCDRKWLPYHHQVGATGATVKPKLYIACGISGASQHIAGMRDSKFIVSINTDPRAAIFQFSDVCVIEDLASFIPVFVDMGSKKL